MDSDRNRPATPMHALPTTDGGTSERGPSTVGVDGDLKRQAMDEAPVGITIADVRKPDQPLVYANEAFERITGYSTEFAVGHNCRFLQGPATGEAPVAEMRRAIDARESTTVELRNYRRDGELFWNEVTIAPLRSDGSEVSHFVGFQSDVTRRKEAELAAERRAERVERERKAREHLLEQLDGVVADVTNAVIRADTQQELERSVVECLSERYVGAWAGRYDPVSRTVVSQVAMGEAAYAVDRDQIPVDENDGDDTVARVVATAYAEGAVTAETLDDAGRATAVVAIPIHYGDACYGTVCVYSRRNESLDGHERAVLAALGRTVATGLNALENQRTLQAREVVELQFLVGRDDHPLVDVAAALDCQLEYVETITDRNQPSTLIEVDGAAGDAVEAALASRQVDLHAVLFDDSECCVVEVTLNDEPFRQLLADYGAELRDVEVDPDRARFTVVAAKESLAKSLADAVFEVFGNAELVGYRQRECRSETRREFVNRIESELTDRQRAALVRAHMSGFFEWPHETTGDELAEAMGISRSTFHQHLRAAHRKLADAIVDQ